MTARQVFENTLTELNKVKAPSLLLQDFNYFVNKAIVNRVDKSYSMYELNQQLTDDLGVLSATAEITLTKKNTGAIQEATFTGSLSTEYFHILDCIAEFNLLKPYKCNSAGSKIRIGVKKLKSGMMSGLLDNYYLKPSIRNPYFYLHNTSTSTDLLNGIRVAGDRKGFPNPVKIELRYGTDTTVATATKLLVDYLKVPQYIVLTEEEIDSDEDTSQVMEFPDYYCYEIIKELVVLLMENASDRRLQTVIPVNQTIAPPVQGAQTR